MQIYPVSNLFQWLRVFTPTPLTLASGLALALALPLIAVAQEAVDTVTLRFASGQDSISGSLTKFENDRFFIESSIGLVVIPSPGVSCVGVACPEETRLDVAEDAGVTLTAKADDMFLRGDLIEIENGDYVLATAFGIQRIPVDLVDCSGSACPEASDTPEIDTSVTLTYGGTTLTGKLLSFQDGTYVLDDSVMGTIHVKAAQFECSGPGCP